VELSRRAPLRAVRRTPWLEYVTSCTGSPKKGSSREKTFRETAKLRACRITIRIKKGFKRSLLGTLQKGTYQGEGGPGEGRKETAGSQ